MGHPARPADLITQIGQRLRLTRVLLSLTQDQASTIAGVSPQRWSNWERGDHTPDILAMCRFVSHTNLTLDWLYRGHLSRLPHELVPEILRRRPDLVLGAPAGARAAEDWDKALREVA